MARQPHDLSRLWLNQDRGPADADRVQMLPRLSRDQRSAHRACGRARGIEPNRRFGWRRAVVWAALIVGAAEGLQPRSGPATRAAISNRGGNQRRHAAWI